MQENILVDVNNLKKYFPITRGILKRRVGSVKAVDGVSFNILKGETLGLVGESGCGKTTTGRLIMRAYQPTAGQVLFYDDEEQINVTQLKEKQLHRYWRKAQMIFQDPYSSLNPRMTVLQIIGEPLKCLANKNDKKREDRVRELLNIVGLDASYANRYPHAFSGGQRQRIGIARALALNPDLIIADEAVSALDVSVQAQIINLMEDLQEKFNLSYLFIAHDLGVVKHISDRVAVMYVGKLVEFSNTEDIYGSPRHPYTEALLSAVPHPDPKHKMKRILLKGDVADASNRPDGCCFHPRCRYVRDICAKEEPPLVNIKDRDNQHLVACHFAEKLELKSIII